VKPPVPVLKFWCYLDNYAAVRLTGKISYVAEEIWSDPPKNSQVQSFFDWEKKHSKYGVGTEAVKSLYVAEEIWSDPPKNSQVQSESVFTKKIEKCHF
jgi:hypothetical protein